ncbi:MAG: ABC transporter permease [Pseudomonadota bacterium]
MSDTLHHALPPAARPRRFKTVRTVGAVILREMMTSYGRSPGGYAWAILQPVGGIALMSFILSTGFRIRTPGLGTSFPLFLATGLLMLSMFLSIAGNVANSLMRNKPLLFYPGVKYTDTLIAGFLLTTLTQILVIYAIIGGIHIVFDLKSILDMGAVLMAIGLSAALGLGVGTLNCFLFNAFPLWGNIWGVLTRPLFLVSCVIFLFEDIPREFQDMAWWNPIIHLVALMRRGFYASYDATYASPLYVGILSMVTLTFGLLFLNRFHRTFLER